MRLATLFFWVALPIAAYVAYGLYGLPHVIFSYSFHDNGDQCGAAINVRAQRQSG